MRLKGGVIPMKNKNIMKLIAEMKKKDVVVAFCCCGTKRTISSSKGAMCC